MKRREKIDNQSIDKTLGLFGALSSQELEAAEERASRRFGNVTARTSSANSRLVAVEPGTEVAAVRGWKWRFAMIAASAAVFLAVVVGGIVWRQAGSFAVVETADGSVYRIVNGKTQLIPVGERLDAGQTVRTNGGESAVLKLADGSRVEMRSQSELSLERTEDGVRILLGNGGIIVNAAKQRGGRHLYVQTKDVTVSVVGTVFLVNAEEGGSRVAVIEGEVRVKQGTTTKSLLPSDQLTTSPSMGLRPVGKEIEWSLQAMEHLALLAKSSSARVGSQNSSPREAFELVSIRPRASSGGGGRGFDGSAAPPACGGSPPQIDPRRFVVTNVTLYRLITMAYGKACAVLELLSETDLMPGGPDWIRSDKFDIEALLPEGSPGYSRSQLSNGDAPKLQAMLQNMLADRFKLGVHRLTKEARVYTLNRASGPMKLTASKDDEVSGAGLSTGLNPIGMISTHIGGKKASMTTLASQLGIVTRMPVLDRTGISGEFTYSFEFAPLEDNPGVADIRASGRWPFLTRPSLFEVLEEQLGLKLQIEQAPVEILVIDRAERPSEN